MYSLEILTLHHWINWMYFRTLNQPFWAPDFYNLCQSSKKPLLIAHVLSSFSYCVGLIFCCWLFFFFFVWIFSCFILGMKTSKKDIFFVFDVFLLQYGPYIPNIIYTHYSLLHHSSLYLILFVFLVVSNSSTENIALGMFPSSRPALVCFKDVSLLHLIV